MVWKNVFSLKPGHHYASSIVCAASKIKNCLTSAQLSRLVQKVKGIPQVMFRPTALLHPDFIAQLQRNGQHPPNVLVPIINFNFPIQSQPLANPAAFLNAAAFPVPRPESVDLREKIRTDILRKLNHEGSESPQQLSPDFSTDSLEGLTMFQGSKDNFGKSSRQYNLSPGMKRPRTGLPSDASKRPRMVDRRDPGFPTGIQWSIPQPMSPSGSERISEAIWQYFLQNQQNEEIYQAKVQLRNALYSIFQGVFPYCGLYIVGSSMNGFGTRTSDMDLCLMLSTQLIDQKKEATEILFLLQKSLRNCSFIKKCQVIRAAVPILRFWDKFRDFECDLNINNAVGIRNTHLLRYYATMDWRVRPLMLFIKYWARFQDINDARKMTISSYSFALMLIHYLQVGCSPPVLPCLHKQFPKVFVSNADIRALKLNEKLTWIETQNKESLGDLFLGFLEFYSFNFNFERDAICVRLGMPVPREIIAKQTENQRQWKCLCIEEPFDRSNTARSVFDEYTFQRVHRVFRNSYLKLRKTRDVESITTTPF